MLPPRHTSRDTTDKFTRYAVEVRYPEEFFVPGIEETQRCVKIAEQARTWIRKKLGLEEA